MTCTEYLRATGNLESDPELAQLFNSSKPIYQNLWSTIFDGTFPSAAASFDYAYDLYDYASYQYTHNETVNAALKASELDWLREMASRQQFSKNGDLSVSGLQEGDMIRAVSGRTLVTKVVKMFQDHISTGGGASKLSLMFGSFQPMLAFFSLSELSRGHSSELFQEIPRPGAASMLFCFFLVFLFATTVFGIQADI